MLFDIYMELQNDDVPVCDRCETQHSSYLSFENSLVKT